MKLECDTDKIQNLSRNIRTEAQRYKEIMKQFYEIVNSWGSNTWVGSASNNYAKYLNSRSESYGKLYNGIINFCDTLNSDVAEIEDTIRRSGVDAND